MQELMNPNLRRSNSTTNATITATTAAPNTHLLRSSSAYVTDHHNAVSSPRSLSRFLVTARSGTDNFFSGMIRTFINTIVLSLPTIASCSIIPHSSSPRKVTGTLFGHRKGHVSFAVQLDSHAEPVLLLELATSTAALVKEMSSGTVRIVLETQKGGQKADQEIIPAARERSVMARGNNAAVRGMYDEPVWSMYCNGRKCGYAVSRACGELDWFVLGTIGSVSVGAGVIPTVAERGGGDGEEVLYMRARFERVIGSRDSEAFYMLNPDGNYGPELSIFLLRL